MKAGTSRTVLSTILAAGVLSLALPGAALAQSQPAKKLTDAKPAQPAHEVKLQKVEQNGQIADQEGLVGKKALDFTLTDTEGKTHTLGDYVNSGKIVVLEWFNPGCPYVVKHHEVNHTMADLSSKYADKDVVWLAVNSGNQDTAEGNQKAREKWSIAYPVLMDGTGDVGKAYGSKNTPTMYVIDKEGVIRYVGAIDNDSGPRTPGTINYVKQALEAVIAGSNVETGYAKPYGCSVKYPRN